MRRFALLLLLAGTAFAGTDLGRTLRALKADDRDRRREALEALAGGEVEAASRSQQDQAFRALRRFLSDRVPGPERALAVQALGRLGGDRVYEELLDRVGEERDDRVLQATEEAFRKGPPDWADRLLQRVHEAPDPLTRAAVMRMLGALPGEAARQRVRLRASMADDWCPWATAIHALADDKDPEALAELEKLLDASDPAVLTAALESLTRITRKQFGRDVVKWKAWLRTREQTEAIEKAEEAAGGERRTYAENPERRTVAGHFFGIPIRGKKVVFVFDVSASMRYKLPIAYEQLSLAVKSLPSSAMFEVVFFNEHVWPWRGRLSHADPITKELLLEHLDTIEIKSYTNLFDSIEKALSLEPDEVFVISDGAPNRGRKKFPSDIRAGILELNRRHARINTVSVVRVVDGEEHIALLAGIAEDSGGETVQRTLK